MWANQFREISEVVFILLNWNPAYRQIIELAHQAGCHATILVVGEPHSIQIEQDTENWSEIICFVSADDILSGRIIHI